MQHSLPRAWQASCESAQTAAGMAGVFFTRLTPLRVAVSSIVVSFATLSFSRGLDETPAFALFTFVVTLVARHAFMFASFTQTGIARSLKARLGSEFGFSVYESALTLLSFAQRLSFVRLLLLTSNDPSGPLEMLGMSSGVAFFAIGVGTSVWATRIVGLDTYHYRDLYSGPRYVQLEFRGPYATLANPMYGAGQLAAYGAALMFLSPLGILAAGLHQVLLYAFNAAVEQPHLRVAARLSTDTALCEELSHTVLDAPDVSDAVPGRWTLPS
jgi:protein-S-isoprenylcysteine O-methyltransferase Ste14